MQWFQCAYRLWCDKYGAVCRSGVMVLEWFGQIFHHSVGHIAHYKYRSRVRQYIDLARVSVAVTHFYCVWEEQRRFTLRSILYVRLGTPQWDTHEEVFIKVTVNSSHSCKRVHQPLLPLAHYTFNANGLTHRLPLSNFSLFLHECTHSCSQVKVH